MDKDSAGTKCHQESGFLQEILTETAMLDRQHVLVDGSLSDGAWYSIVSNRIIACMFVCLYYFCLTLYTIIPSHVYVYHSLPT